MYLRDLGWRGRDRFRRGKRAREEKDGKRLKGMKKKANEKNLRKTSSTLPRTWLGDSGSLSPSGVTRTPWNR